MTKSFVCCIRIWNKSKDLSIKSKHIFIQFNRDKEILLPLMPYLIQKQQQKQKQEQE